MSDEDEPVTQIDFDLEKKGPDTRPDIPLAPAGDRRRGDRRGTGIPVVRFTNERRGAPRGDRRQRVRRAFERFPLRLPVTIRHGGESATFDSLDFSVLGCRLGGTPALPVGSLLRVSFSLPDDLAEFPIVTWAQVVSWKTEVETGGQLGLKFVGLRACDARRMGRFLVRQAKAKGKSRGPGAPYPF